MTVAETLYGGMDGFSPSERKISRALLSDYPSAGLATVASLAELSHTSAPTVIRFVTRLGFENFGAFQSALRRELTTRSTSPLSRAEEEVAADGTSDDLPRGGAARARLVTETYRRTPPAEIEAIVGTLTAHNNHVYITGGQYSGFIGQILQVQLSKVRTGVHYLHDPLRRDLAYLSELRKRDVVVLFDVRRYEDSLLQVARLARERSATVALFTDPWLSPAAAYADIVLPASVDVTFFDSLVGVLALAEAVAHETASRLEGAIPRLRTIESLR
jgi:DNA-binding MurR/RpiR family transcriptional regulator